LLNSPSAEANINLNLIIDFLQPVNPKGTEINIIFEGLKRNPVERLNLKAIIFNN